MINKKFLIDEINKGCKLLFDSSFHLEPSTVNRFRITGNQSSKAVNNYKSIKEEINVIKWFDVFWIYLEIAFVEKNTFISLSVFQGKQMDNEKNQLFRAEWDDYNNDNEKHPQPHWHITSNQSIENTFKEYTDTFENEGFAELLQEEKTKIIDVNKIHFAMNGNWINDDNHIQSINDNSKIVKWFQGLFSHLRVQLEYVNK
ncbi:hypothetical protein JBL43_19685 [Aureibaculum sp. A20]|uniref:Uncharacterized protein n=1 Tax=Aureibaculum flavum TaxID=2795986 RepID=A0ABS0WX03_9FLAO|nr:hypothetical protein [Aureibaculum flavum]MBJ2176482.1 hypothetical protein [Aureibaculum flavum]